MSACPTTTDCLQSPIPRASLQTNITCPHNPKISSNKTIRSQELPCKNVLRHGAALQQTVSQRNVTRALFTALKYCQQTYFIISNYLSMLQLQCSSSIIHQSIASYIFVILASFYSIILSDKLYGMYQYHNIIFQANFCMSIFFLLQDWCSFSQLYYYLIQTTVSF